MNQLNKTLELYLVKKAPALPKNIKEILVKLAHGEQSLGWCLAPGDIGIFGYSAMMSSIPYAAYGMMRAGGGFSLAALFLVATGVFEALAIPGLMKRKMAGWNFLYYAVWVGAVSSLLNYDIVGRVVSVLISLYLLFQVKSYYK